MDILNKNIQKEKDLKRKMRELKIFEKDIKEVFIRSTGKGGQNVNKVATCVQLFHAPSGIQVKCQQERSQALNRYHARLILFKKIERQVQERKLKLVQESEKRKRRNRKRPVYLKESILEDKHKNSQKKESRRKLFSRDIDLRKVV